MIKWLNMGIFPGVEPYERKALGGPRGSPAPTHEIRMIHLDRSLPQSGLSRKIHIR
jgi:hypothetical protein